MKTIKRQALFIFSLIGIVIVSLAMMTTYAYQSTRVDYDEDAFQGLSVQSGVLDVNYVNNDRINVDNMPLLNDYMSGYYTEFTIDNSKSDNDVSFYIELTELDFSKQLITSDFRYTLNEVTKSNEKNISEGDFSDLTNNDYKLRFNDSYYLNINKKESKTYKLYIWLKETESNQNYLENSYFKAKIKITSQFKSAVYENSLAFKLINNGIINSENIIDDNNVGLIKFEDSYYYRGNVLNNYLNFNNMCFRIIKINKDNSIKLVLEDKDNTCQQSVGNYEIGIGSLGNEDDYSKELKDSLYEFQNKYLKNNFNKLKSYNWCLNNKKYDYSDNSYIYTLLKELNDKKFSNVCEGITMDKYNDSLAFVNILSLEDVVYSGGKLNNESNTYLYNEEYQKEDFVWTNSLSSNINGTINAFVLNKNILKESEVNNNYSYRPTITLVDNILYISGTGTKDDPFIID